MGPGRRSRVVRRSWKRKSARGQLPQRLPECLGPLNTHTHTHTHWPLKELSIPFTSTLILSRSHCEHACLNGSRSPSRASRDSVPIESWKRNLTSLCCTWMCLWFCHYEEAIDSIWPLDKGFPGRVLSGLGEVSKLLSSGHFYTWSWFEAYGPLIGQQLLIDITWYLSYTIFRLLTEGEISQVMSLLDRTIW